MLGAIRLFIIDYKYRYTNSLYVLLEILIEAFALWVLYQSSKVILPRVEFFQDFTYSYFDFVFIAEMTLRLPSLMIHAPILGLKFARHYKIIPLIINTQNGLIYYLSQYSIAKLLKELLKMVLLFFIAYFAYQFSPATNFYLNLATIQILFTPLFFSFGFLGAIIFIHFGRGEGLIMKTFSVLAIFSGLYFPLTVFPEIFQQAFTKISPLESLISTSRASMNSPISLNNETILYFILGIITLILTSTILIKLKIKKLYEFDFKN